MVEARINKLAKEGGIKSDLFWKIRKQLINKSKDKEEYDTISEEGETILDPEKSRDYIASFYEKLYQTRAETAGYERWTEDIKNMSNQLKKILKTCQKKRNLITLK